MRADTAFDSRSTSEFGSSEIGANAPHRRPPRRSVPFAGPERTCLGCRRRGVRADLIRVVLDPTMPTRVVVDERRSAPGRGGWLHPEAACLALAQRRRAFRRAFRLAFDPDTSELVESRIFHEGQSGGAPADGPSSPGKQVGS